jgi:hypothetical protein
MAWAKNSGNKLDSHAAATKGMPYLVVTVSPDGVSATAVESKDEARILASKKTLMVVVQDNVNNDLSDEAANLSREAGC